MRLDTLVVFAQTEEETFSSLSDVTIPDVNDNKIKHVKIVGRLSKVERHAFLKLDSLITIDFGKTEVIASSAVDSCMNLRWIRMGSELKYLFDKPFVACESLEYVSVDDENVRYKTESGVIYDLKDSSILSVPENFRESKFVVPQWISRVSDGCFSDCRNIKSISMSKKVRYVGSRAFSGCRNLESVDLSDNIKQIQYLTFANCVSLKSIRLPEALEYISTKKPFYNTNAKFECGVSSLCKVVDGVLYSKDNRFLIYCPSYAAQKRHVIVEGTQFIYPYAFHNCLNINEIVFPESLLSVGDIVTGEGAFVGCDNITDVYVKYDFTKVGRFYVGKNIKTYHVKKGDKDLFEYYVNRYSFEPIECEEE